MKIKHLFELAAAIIAAYENNPEDKSLKIINQKLKVVLKPYGVYRKLKSKITCEYRNH